MENIGKPTYVYYSQDASDFVQESLYGGIDLPSDAFYQIHALSSRHPPSTRPGSPLKPPFRPQSQPSTIRTPKVFKMCDGPIYLPPQIYKLLSQDAMKALKAYSTEDLNRFHMRKVHNDTIPTKNGRELMEKWVSELKDKFLGPNWQRMLSCAYTTQLLHSTGEVCWNNRDSYFIWFEFVC